MTLRRLALTLMILLACALVITAQDNDGDEDALPEAVVYVTTQDFSSLRTGPGTAFERITVIDPVVTLPAYGRTADTRWVQVAHEGQLGWIASILLVWSGDMINLPVDGIPVTPFIRRAGAVAVTVREAPIYETEIVAEDQVGVLPAGTTVELTGRLGERGYFRFQILYQDKLYWIGSWDVRVVDGDYRRLLDTAYLFPYGRLVRELEQNIAVAIGSYRQIEDVWLRLGRGDAVRCSPIPVYVPVIVSVTDAQREPNFVPAAVALENGIASINRAIAIFENACGNPDAFLTPDNVAEAQDELANARRNLILVGSLLEPLRIRNPLLETFAGTN